MSTFVVLKQPSDPNAPLVLPGDVIKIHYEALVVSTGTVFESTQQARSFQPRTIFVGQDKVSKGLMKALSAIKRGMKIRLIVPSHQAYGEIGIPGVVPPNSEIQYTVEVVEH